MGEELVKTLWDSPCVMVLWKLLITFELIFGACLIGFLTKLQKYTPSTYVDQLVRNTKNETLLHQSKLVIRYTE